MCVECYCGSNVAVCVFVLGSLLAIVVRFCVAVQMLYVLSEILVLAILLLIFCTAKVYIMCVCVGGGGGGNGCVLLVHTHAALLVYLFLLF